MLLKYLGPACLAGVTLPDWFSLLATNRFRVSPGCWGKAAFLTGSSLLTSLVRPVEQAVWSSRLKQHQLEAPVFILGCWRSGTTHLHQLLCLDQRFGFPNMYQTMYPHTFLLSEPWLRPLLDLMTPRKRFMDNMKQGLQEPHEDEMALAILCQRSNMLSWAFPKNAEIYDRFLSFQQVCETDRDRWKQSLDLFVRKVSLKTGRRLVLKSPNHTARMQLISELYPNAVFLHIHRHPYDVYRSLCHMVRNVQPVWALQRMDPQQIPELVIRTYKLLYDAYLDQKAAVIPDRLFEVSYQRVTQQPLETLQDAYQHLRLGDFSSVRPHVEQYIQQQASYERNRHADLSSDEKQRLHNHWERFFDEWHYERRA
ncbi:MAG: sulfotransferase [Planctomycetaceae bacterium]